MSAEGPPRAGDRQALLRDLAWGVVPPLVLGLAVGLLWPHLVEPAMSTRTEQGLSTSEGELGNAFSADGWFVLLGLGGGVLVGAGLMLRRRGHEVVVLVTALLASFAAARAASLLGGLLGPPDPVEVLTDAAVGTTAPSALELSSRTALLVWPLGVALGALLVLLSVTRLDRMAHERDERSPQEPSAGATSATVNG